MDVYNTGHASPGGNPVNVAVYTLRLGEEASYTGVVGSDRYGRIMIDALKSKGVDVSHVRIMEGSTAISYIDLINGDRVFGDYEEGVLANFKLTDEDIDFLCSHDMVVTGIWGMIEDDLWRIRERGIPVTFDFATKLDSPIVKKAIGNVDYAFFSYDEGVDDYIQNYMRETQKQGPKLVVVTMGERGSLAYDGKDFTSCGIVQTNVVDTMGAGDSYIAGFLQGTMHKKPLKECMVMGAQNASITLKYMGAW